MKRYYLCFELLSDAAFSRGDGLAGEVDSEIQHDELGCPFLGGRALKGILVNECADLIAALPASERKTWQKAAGRLFGTPGGLQDEETLLRIGDAKLPEEVRLALQLELQATIEDLPEDSSQQDKKVKEIEFRDDTLHILTAIRAQTALDETGVAKRHSLRSRRVILRQTPFEAELVYTGPTSGMEFDNDLALLSACAAAFRRAGASRNRGLGHLKAHLEEEAGGTRVEIKPDWQSIFQTGVAS